MVAVPTERNFFNPSAESECAPLEEIVAHVAQLRAEGSYQPRIDALPYYDGPVGE